jgi:hypothetical protein
MDRQSRNWTFQSGVSGLALLAASLCNAATPLPIALAESALAAVPETLEELDEIVLQGKRLQQRIREAETRFYRVYNEVNSSPDLDVTCSFVYRDRSSFASRILDIRQGCVPMFVVNNMRAAPLYVIQTSYSCTTGASNFIYSSVAANSNGQVDMYTPPGWSGGGLHPDTCGTSINLAAPTGPSAELVWLSRRSEFQAHLARAIATDERLQELAGTLHELAAEGRTTLAMINAGRNLRMQELRCIAPPRAAPVCRK